MDLTQFLLARITEDELAANMAIQTHRPEWDLAESPNTGTPARVVERGGMLVCAPTEHEMGEHIVRWAPVRVLTECETKRGVVNQCAGAMTLGGLDAPDLAAQLLLTLALAYADHTDFDPTWIPGG